ncbi:hypothetical protein GCM10027396_23820 [Insolitispirillum peregrinum]
MQPQNTAGIGFQAFALACQGKVPGVAQKQGHARLCLEPRDMGRNGRRGTMHPLRGATEAFCVDAGDECAKQDMIKLNNSFKSPYNWF